MSGGNVGNRRGQGKYGVGVGTVHDFLDAIEADDLATERQNLNDEEYNFDSEFDKESKELPE